jgi:NAD(P)-dependent dehydrogenase (short-subunit alcohol dehydrogenase family)
MDLRYRLAVVTGAGSEPGRDIAVALSRTGAAVLCVDTDLRSLDDTVRLVSAARVRSWSLQADPAEDGDLLLMAARARDLGGMDLLVTTPGSASPAGAASTRAPEQPAEPVAGQVAGQVADQAAEVGLRTPLRLTRLFLDGLPERRGRRDGTPAVVAVLDGAAAGEGSAARFPALAVTRAGTPGPTDPAASSGVRVMAVLPGAAAPAAVARAVVDLLSRGAAGTVVDLGRAAGAGAD